MVNSRYGCTLAMPGVIAKYWNRGGQIFSTTKRITLRAISTCVTGASLRLKKFPALPPRNRRLLEGFAQSTQTDPTSVGIAQSAHAGRLHLLQ